MKPPWEGIRYRSLLPYDPSDWSSGDSPITTTSRQRDRTPSVFTLKKTIIITRRRGGRTYVRGPGKSGPVRSPRARVVLMARNEADNGNRGRGNKSHRCRPVTVSSDGAMVTIHPPLREPSSPRCEFPKSRNLDAIGPFKFFILANIRGFAS